MGSKYNLGGTAYVKVGGRQIALRGNLKISPEMTESEIVVGMDGPHGFIERPRGPYFEGDFSLVSEVTIEDLRALVDETWQLELNNGTSYVYSDGRVTTAMEIDAAQGQFNMRVDALNRRRV